VPWLLVLSWLRVIISEARSQELTLVTDDGTVSSVCLDTESQ